MLWLWAVHGMTSQLCHFWQSLKKFKSGQMCVCCDPRISRSRNKKQPAMQCYRDWRNLEIGAKLMPNSLWPKRKWWSLGGSGPSHPQNADVTELECSCLVQQRTVSKWKKRRNTVLAVTARQFRGANVVSCKSGWNTGMKWIRACEECHRMHRDRVPLGAVSHMSLSPYRNAVRKCTHHYLQPQNSVI